jgi:hypothetical protein
LVDGHAHGLTLLPHPALSLLSELARHVAERHQAQRADRQEGAEDEEKEDPAGDTTTEKRPFNLHEVSSC